MQNATTPVPTPAQKARKAYHAPRVEDYGAVNELTRSSPTPPNYDPSDGPTFYTSNV